MAELLPCSFCGGEATVHLDANTIHGAIMYKVLCKKGCCVQHLLFFNMQESFDAWNTRSRDTAQKPINVTTGHNGDYGRCPHCNSSVSDYTDSRRCRVCGQALGWKRTPQKEEV